MNCEWGNWGEWSKCSMDCGNGTQTSNRSKLRKAAHGGKDCIGNITKSQNCNEHPCDGKYLDIACIFENIFKYFDFMGLFVPNNCKLSNL